MGIFSQATAETQPETPESLKAALIEARSERDETIAQAKADYDLDKAWVIDQATKRVTAVHDLIKDLQSEHDALTDVLSEAENNTAVDGDRKATLGNIDKLAKSDEAPGKSRYDA